MNRDNNLDDIAAQIKAYNQHQQTELMQEIDKFACTYGMYYKALLKHDVPHELACTLVAEYQRCILARALGFEHI